MTTARDNSATTLELYRKTLNFNVIGRYDPKIKQLLFHTPHATVYKWEAGENKWNKLEYQGVLAIYLRDVREQAELPVPHQEASAGAEGRCGEVLSGRDIYNYALIVLNRINPENFSIAIAPNSVVNKRRLFSPEENVQQPLEPMDVEVKDELVIIKNLRKEVYGIWIHTPTDRQNIYDLLKYLLENEPKDSFA
ncbi:AGR402Cp [Eremothecium gossypii ATCC 10895]|uniref:mRNA-decapping enzyme subunit 1 n=1 Tax=Eremothecium gossypii (strain ATCC 10895 / CBS 109.51 / FGSC 9923 / NRRL Y-1056) TaxID=284811 RepID=DCP1_EREGS|nr:AGR402Cp [Eremothecium gossypii ATCC 10895]Q74Z05.1 RecName: Full=mRNA-decapping enzyme subunit 1 [Eremothecium gossypii ATCC 10895]AAS54892.1 AGR402Cp [Eremothecium gossypii ATCC 10895]AEY99224.1 FAGR402Cp [Eremothecium gossypii FDAG1]